MIEKTTLVEPFSSKTKDKINEIAKKLQEYSQRHIYIVDENQKPVGIISITDIMNKVVVQGKNSCEVTAEEIMTRTIYPLDDKESVKKAYKIMTEKNIVSLPITEKGKLVGILTLKEAVKYVTNPNNID